MKDVTRVSNRPFRLIVALLLCAGGLSRADGPQGVVFQKFPHTEGLEILCWVVQREGDGYLSQIVVLETDGHGRASVSWRSQVDPAYNPKIRFVDDLMGNGVPLALVERQAGAASSRLDVLGKVAGRVRHLLQIDGFKFDVEHLDGATTSLVIAHTDASVLDVPVIYRWEGTRFVEDGASHAQYYRRLLVDDKSRLPPNASAVVLLNLARIAVWSGDRMEARTILGQALSRERSKGSKADKETLRRIIEALRALEHNPR